MEKQLASDPVDCVHCGACVPECPVDAIYDEDYVLKTTASSGKNEILEGHERKIDRQRVGDFRSTDDRNDLLKQ